MSSVTFNNKEADYSDGFLLSKVTVSHNHPKNIDIINSITSSKTTVEKITKIMKLIAEIEKCSEQLACYTLSLFPRSYRKINYTVLEHEIRQDENLIAILLNMYKELKLAE